MADELPPGFAVVQQPQIDDLPPGFSVAGPEPSVAKDVALSAASGLPRGVAETAMLPVTLSRLGQSGAGYIYDKGEGLVRAIFGLDPVSDEDRANRAEIEAMMPSTAINDAIFGTQDTAREAMNSVLYEPKTRPGKFAGTIAEFVAPGGLPSRAARSAPTAARAAQHYAEDLVGNVFTPAILSEGAGQMAEGSEYEGLARLLGAVTGNVGTATARAYNAPEALLRRSTSEMTDAEWAAAVGLQNNTTGVRLTGPEAIAQATGGASALPNVQRVVEGSIDGRALTAPFFAARPAQVDTAVGGVLDQIAPQSANPSVLGPRTAEAAENVITGVRQDINAQTRPLYQAAEPHIIPDADFAPIAADPRFQAGLERLRGNPELSPDYAAFPDNSVAVVDAVTKDMAARGQAMANSANPLYGPELAARNTAGAASARSIARDPARGGSAEYDQALAQQEQLRRTVLQPVTEGPVGGVAAAKTTESAGNALLPRNPLSGSADEAADATRRLIAEDAEATTGLVRQNLSDRYARASTETQEGSREFAGAKFHKDVAGNAEREALLTAIFGELPNQQAAAALPELLDVLQATGRRKPIGSATEFNRSINADLGEAAPISRLFGLARTAGASFLTNAGDATRRAALRSNLGTLADMFVDPNSVELIRNAINRSARINLEEAAARTTAQGAPMAYDPRN